MKMKLTILILFFVTLFSCKSKLYTLENLPEKQLVFGKGGGISGAVDTYVLLENGQLFHANSLTKQSKELTTVPKKKSKELFQQLAALQLSTMDFNHPGNMYYFIKEVTADTVSNITWGNINHEVDPLCKTLYGNLMEQLK